MSQQSELVLILSPSENDSVVAAAVLREARMTASTCEDIHDLCKNISKGCGVIVLAEEAIPLEQVSLLQKCLKEQEAWSDIPVILLTGEGPARSWESFSASGNISILERPFSRLTLVRAVTVALRARQKQYLVKQLLEQQARAAQKRDEFFATLSHELRTPLNVILGWIEMLKDPSLSENQQTDALLVLEKNARMQKSLIDDLLDTSRIITGKLHFEASELSLSDILKSIAKDFIPRAEEKKLKIILDIPDDDFLIMADEQRFSQIISNLITNAIKFTPANGSIQISLKDRGGLYSVSIKDSGQGIEPAFLPHVFDRLKQEDMSTTRSHGGLGLGLAIAAHIIEQHHGKIEAKSAGRDKGSEFIVTVPALSHQVKARRSEIPDSIKPNSLEGVKVLVVDDSLDILELINLWLKKAKAEVKMANSAPEALEQLPIFKPDVLVSDIGMPQMDGYELIRKIRSLRDEKIRNTKAVALTAYAKDEERTKALSAGFQMHISKPISNNQLVASLSTLVADK